MGVQRAAAKQLEGMNYIRGKVRAHERALDAGTNPPAPPRDFIDAYLSEKRRVEALFPDGADRTHFFTGQSSRSNLSMF